MDSESRIKNIISKVKINVNIMMQNRGYILNKELEENRLLYKVQVSPQTSYPLYVLIILSIDDKKLDTNKINNVVNYIKIFSEETPKKLVGKNNKQSNEDNKHFKNGSEDKHSRYIHTILIYSNVITPKTKEIISTYNYKDLHMNGLEVFPDKMFMYDITKQKYFVRHEIVSPEDKKMLITKYKNNLAKILSTDAMCRYYGAVKGDILKVYRNDDTIFYRMCM